MTASDMHGKITLVTGASAGLGRAAALGLAQTGATVVLVCRSAERGEAARNEMAARSGNAAVELMVCDLSSQLSVRQLAAGFRAKFPRLNVLINNAAVFLAGRQITSDGVETMFATNHLGPFLLTNLLRESLAHGAPARVINVSAPSTVPVDFADVNGDKRFSAPMAFGASKAANLLFTFELARRLQPQGVTVNAYHPGLVRTGLMDHAPLPMRLLSPILNLSALTPERAAQGLVELATSPEFAGVTGQLIHHGQPLASRFANDRAAQERLWQVSAELVHLDS